MSFTSKVNELTNEEKEVLRKFRNYKARDFKITKVSEPVKWISKESIKEFVKDLGKRLKTEPDMKKRAKIIIIKEEMKELAKLL